MITSCLELSCSVLLSKNALALGMKYFSIIAIVSLAVFVLLLFLKEMGYFVPNPPLEDPNKSETVKKTILNHPFFIKYKTQLVIIGMVLISRLIIALVAYSSIVMLENQYVSLTDFIQTYWNRWDAPHFISIAQDGYVTEGDAQNFIVFFPLYPMLIRVLGFIVRNYSIAGIIISNVCLCIASVYLYKLSAVDFDHETSMKAVFLFLIFPLSFFCGIVYTESLFIALTILTFYHIRKQDWINAGTMGLLAAFTRNFGVLLIVPLFIEILICFKNKQIKRYIEPIISLICVPLGLFLYLLVNKVVTGDWLAFLRYQKEHWHNQFAFLPKNVMEHVMYMFDWEPKVSVTIWIPQVICFLIILFMIYYATKKMRSSYCAYMLAYLIIAFSPSWLISGPRYTLAIFPIYILFALLAKKEYIWYMLIMASTLLLGFYTIGFVNGYSVM